MLADAYRIGGAPEVGLAQIAEAERLAEATQVESVLAETLRLRGDLLAQTGGRMAAEASYRDGIALAQPRDGKLFELRAATSLARLWRDQGKCTEAHELLAPIYGWFTEGFDTAVLKEACALLDELGTRVHPGAAAYPVRSVAPKPHTSARSTGSSVLSARGGRPAPRFPS
ncbi:MAG: hypothetical protein JO139_05710 [Alphaproteobacteria bacterium]|nr:hypothetical protein [Alphaproteobacteria bacterium]